MPQHITQANYKEMLPVIKEDEFSEHLSPRELDRTLYPKMITIAETTAFCTFTMLQFTIDRDKVSDIEVQELRDNHFIKSVALSIGKDLYIGTYYSQSLQKVFAISVSLLHKK